MGEVFAGRYELQHPIAEGAMGTVWIAWDAKTQRLVAAKVLRQSDSASVLRFIREQAVRIHHPHVLVPLGWAGEDDRVLFTMPLVAGGSVADLVGDFGPLPPLLVAELLRQVLSGLAAVHAAQIVHRDIKPANILLDATGTGRPHAYLSDFGIAVDLTQPRWTHTGVLSGTPGYLAPELEAFAAPEPPSDLYAVGQVALTMLTSARVRERGRLPERPAEVPDELWALLTALVAVDPHQRPTIPEALAALTHPSLAWAGGAMGEIEIFDHVTAVAPAPTEAVLRTATIRPTPTPVADREADIPTRHRRPPDEPTPPDNPRAPHRGRVLIAAAVGLAALVAVLLWSPWRMGASDRPVTPAPTASTTPSAAIPRFPSPSTSLAPTVSTAAQPPTTTGSVSVGVVVVNPGQPCDFTQIGLRERTTGGVDVVCRLRSDGSYAWIQP